MNGSNIILLSEGGKQTSQRHNTTVDVGWSDLMRTQPAIVGFEDEKEP